MNKINQLQTFTQNIIMERDKVIDQCIVNYAKHLGKTVNYLTLSYRVHYHPEVTKFVSPDGEVIFEVYDPVFKGITQPLSQLEPEVVSSTLSYREFWRDA